MIQATLSGRQGIYESPLFGVLQIEGLSLFVPQYEIDSVESVASLDIRTKQAGQLGAYRIDEIEYPLYYLDRHLKLAQPPPTAEQCVLLRNNEYQFGLLCEQLETLRREQIQLRAVPTSMQSEHSPLQAFAINQGKRLGCVTTVGSLQCHLQQLQQPGKQVPG